MTSMRPHLCLIVSLRRHATQPRPPGERRDRLRAIDIDTDTQRHATLHSFADWFAALRAGLRDSYRR